MFVTGSSQASNASAAYQISNSLRFQSASSQYIVASAIGNRLKWTWSGWIKRGRIDADQNIFASGGTSGATTRFLCQFNTANTITIGYGTFDYLITSQVFRDPSAWYHIVVVYDSGNATATDRIQLYVNGSRVTAFSTNNLASLALNNTGAVNNGNLYMGQDSTSAINYFDGYRAEINFVDGLALTPSSFGTTNPYTGQWVAQKYVGSYGASTSGFYLNFSNGSSTTTLGYDYSGNANNSSLFNFTRSAGSTDCWAYDAPSGNGAGPATQPNSNYATLSPLSMTSTCTLTRSNLNAAISGNVSYNNQVRASIGMPPGTGKYYFEFTNNGGALPAAVFVGVIDAAFPITTRPDTSSTSYWTMYCPDGSKYVGTTNSAYGASWTTNNVIGCAVDMGAGTITFYKDGVSQGAVTMASSAVTLVPIYYHSSGSSNSAAIFNSGIRSFAYTPPSGFKALCTGNLPASSIVKGNQVMDATTFTGNGTGQSIANAASFKPDLVWWKDRTDSGIWHMFSDSVRGTGRTLSSNQADAEYSGYTSLTAFNSNGFTLGNDPGTGYYGWNLNGKSYVAWQWQAGQGVKSTNTDGSIASVVTVNRAAGFSVATYSGNSVNSTVGHGLGVAPKFIVIKNRTQVDGWAIGHSSLTSWAYVLQWDTDAQTSVPTFFNSTAPTSSVFSVGTSTNTNTTGVNYVAYVWAEIAGFSKFGSYTGNGSADGPFVYTGFRPKYVLCKCISSNLTNGAYWLVQDTSRSPYNATDLILYPDLSNNEGTGEPIDILSNGFKIRNSIGRWNSSGQTFIYAAFAENPFAQANAR